MKNTNSAIQTQIKIGDTIIDGYKLPSGDWCLSLRGLGFIRLE